MAGLGPAPVPLVRGLAGTLVNRAFQTAAQHLALDNEALDPGGLRARPACSTRDIRWRLEFKPERKRAVYECARERIAEGRLQVLG